MSKPRLLFRCSTCGAPAPKWAGRCTECGEWNTIEEAVPTAPGWDAPAGLVAASAPVPITAVDALDGRPVATGVDELDRVLGGGLVPGSVTLLGGEPGVGKSTLVLQMLAASAARGDTALYVSGEESPQQVGMRARRLGALHDGILIVAETSLPAVLTHIESTRPALCVVDSVQTLFDPATGSAPGSVAQVRDCSQQLVATAKRLGITTVLIGHVTKDGALAGPRVLEHVVDTVLSLEGDRHHALRILRAAKHRFGPTEEIGLMSLGTAGLDAVPDPSGMFLSDRRPGIAGSVVTPTVEGRRPLLVEVQALVTATAAPNPRRSATGLDTGRLSLMLAVLAKRACLSSSALDVYTMAVGGVRVTEPGADLAVCLAVASAMSGRPAPAGTVVCGEVGLGGELRRVGRMEHRLSEAARMGFTTAVVPMSSPARFEGIEVQRVPNLQAAVALLDLGT
jgi:DNA repair protein RadA/Sms